VRKEKPKPKNRKTKIQKKERRGWARPLDHPSPSPPRSPLQNGSLYIGCSQFSGVSTILRSCATCRQFLGAKAHALQAVGCRLVAPNPIDLTDTSNSFMFTNRAMTRDGNVVPYWEFSQFVRALLSPKIPFPPHTPPPFFRTAT
jgi:hypothetical protein